MPQDYSTPLPRRVKQGECLENGLFFETATQEMVRVTWEQIVFVYLGKIQTKTPSAPQKAPQVRMGKMIAGLAAGPFGTALYDLTSKKEKSVSAPALRDSFLVLDLYALENPQPFRFDSTGTNFRKFLKEEAGYSGEINLLNFTRKISVPLQAYLDPGITEFLEHGKTAIPAFSSRDEFAWNSYEKYRKKQA